MTTETITTAAAVRGRERTCHQCGTTFRAPRQARYCSNACRVKAKRGRPPKAAPRPDGSPTTPVGRLLVHLGMAGLVSLPCRSEPKPGYALLVPRHLAYAEAQQVFEHKQWGPLTEAEFDEALAADGLKASSSDSAETRLRKSLSARLRAA